ncbi:MAG: hypothetical protein ACM359_02490 [Bacillota bacterium]
MKLWRNLLMVVAVLSLVGVVQAQQPAKKTEKKDAKTVAGQIVKVDGSKITVKSKGTDAKETTITVDDKTKITVDGKSAKLADLKEGQHVKVTPGTSAAKKITATTEKKGDKKDAGKKDTAKKDTTTKDKAAK